MRRQASRFVPQLAWFVSLCVLTGCDSGEAPPPAPAIPQAGADATTPADLLPPPPGSASNGAQIAMVLPRGIEGTMLNWEQVIRQIVGRSSTAVDAVRPRPADGADQQVKMIAQALNSGVDAIVVVPEPEPVEGLSAVLADADRLGIPVVSIARPLTDGERSATLVARAHPATVSREIVKALLDDAGALALPKTGPVLVLVNENGPEAGERSDAVVGALREMGLSLAGDAPRTFAGSPDEVEQIIGEVRKENPKLPMVIATDDIAFRSALTVLGTVPAGDRYLIAGFVADPENLGAVKGGMASAAVDCNEVLLARRVAETVLAAAAGEKLPPRVDVRLNVVRSPTLRTERIMPEPSNLRQASPTTPEPGRATP